jgi:hypothetical protein
VGMKTSHSTERPKNNPSNVSFFPITWTNVNKQQISIQETDAFSPSSAFQSHALTNIQTLVPA